MSSAFRRFLSPLLLISCSLLLCACPRYPDLPPGTVKEITSSAVIEQQQVSVAMPEEELLRAGSREYLVGPGDVLAINIPGRTQKPDEGDGGPQGFRVYSSGKVLLPLVGGVHVAGLSVDEIQEKLQEVFRPYIREPVITVEIVEYKSRPLYLLGSFKQPGVQYLDRSVNLLQGIALGGGLDESANLRGARLVRENRIVPVDIFDLVHENDLSQNIPLLSGDTLYVPGNQQQNVFVLGAVEDEGPIPMVNGRLSLLQALSTAGIGKQSYDPTLVRIIRSRTPTRGELLVLDLGTIMAGETLPFPLQNGDVVYVPRSGIGDWNQALAEMLPTLQAIGGIIQPFVLIEAITDDD